MGSLKASATRLYREGLTQQQVADEMGIAQALVSQLLRGEELRRAYPRKKIKNPAAQKNMVILQEAGFTQEQIAAMFGVSNSTVSRAITAAKEGE